MRLDDSKNRVSTRRAVESAIEKSKLGKKKSWYHLTKSSASTTEKRPTETRKTAEA